jgi:hypothetical protein
MVCPVSLSLRASLRWSRDRVSNSSTFFLLLKLRIFLSSWGRSEGVVLIWQRSDHCLSIVYHASVRSDRTSLFVWALQLPSNETAISFVGASWRYGTVGKAGFGYGLSRWRGIRSTALEVHVCELSFSHRFHLRCLTSLGKRSETGMRNDREVSSEKPLIMIRFIGKSTVPCQSKRQHFRTYWASLWNVHMNIIVFKIMYSAPLTRWGRINALRLYRRMFHGLSNHYLHKSWICQILQELFC